MSDPTMPRDAAAVYDAAPPEIRAGMLALRARIQSAAADTHVVSAVSEGLRWGQPSCPAASGTPLRIAAIPAVLTYRPPSVPGP